ncbi:unnamed protein product [Pedinophyceae sp. YPF-701]|nr:unnamed protein product [Pedinophyceae sp. YPF-701]
MASLKNPEEVFEDYMQRRKGVVLALTQDVDDFFDQCSPDRENLCLYGHSDGTWEVALPAEEIPAELPEPTLGINFARDGMNRKDWLSLIAVHSDCWLMAVATFNAARFERQGRAQLLGLINGVPTVYECVTGKVGKHDGLAGTKRGRGQAGVDDFGEDGGGGEAEGDPCPISRRSYRPGEFWIACDKCDRWFYGKAVNMTPSRAEQAKTWKCPFCEKAAGKRT